MRRNVGLYRLHQIPAGALFWMPTTFLFLISRFGFADALRLQAIYYAAVVVMEVPSGWFSDRVGRVITLRLVAVFWIGAHLLFLTANDVITLALAQIALAAGYAFLSGTDSSFLFDSMEAIGTPEEFAGREAISRRGMLVTTAISALVGGGLGLVDLRLPFVAALVAAVAQLAIALRFTEPPRQDVDSRSVARFGRDLLATVHQLRHRLMAWVVLYLVAQVIVVHLAADLSAPYLAELLGLALDDPRRAALAVGALAATAAFVGALVVGAVPALVDRFGLTSVLLTAAVVPTVVVGAMAVVTSVVVVPLLALRGAQSATSSVAVPALVGAHVGQQHRATFLSMASLIGRLGYGVVLLGLSAIVGRETGASFVTAAVIALVLLAGLVIGRGGVNDFPSDLAHRHEHHHEPVDHDHLHVHDDDHHGHQHDPPVVGAHSHHHQHEPVQHSHAHSRDRHHGHGH